MIVEGPITMDSLYEDFKPYVISRLKGYGVPYSRMEDAIQEVMVELVADIEACPTDVKGKMDWAAKHASHVGRAATISDKSHLSGINPVTAHRVNKAIRDFDGDLEAASASLSRSGGGVSRSHFYDIVQALRGAFYEDIPEAESPSSTDWARVSAVNAAVRALKPEQRDAVMSLYGMDGREVKTASALAREWGISEAAVRARAKNALRNLEKALSTSIG